MGWKLELSTGLSAAGALRVLCAFAENASSCVKWAPHESRGPSRCALSAGRRVYDKLTSQLADKCEELATTLHFGGHFDLDSKMLMQELKNFPDLPSASMTPLELVSFMHEQDLSEIYPNYWTGLRIAATLPVTVAQAERSFSKLKLIKTYLRSTMSQERFSGLAVISINHAIGEQISYGDIVDEFASRKARKVNI